MLYKIKRLIDREIKGPSISFEEYYNQYLMKIQDYCISLEAEYHLKGKSAVDQFHVIDQSIREVLEDDI